MGEEIDLRNQPDTEHRKIIDDALEKRDTGDELHVVADQDIDPHLIRYQIATDHELEWEHEDPDAEPRELQLRKAGELSDGELGTFDVRDLIPQRRHEVLLETFDQLHPEDGFVLVNDHDPKPLYHELRSMHDDVVGWEYASRDAGEWRVEITKTGESESTDDDVVSRYDVREIPKQERHETIHHRYGMIPDGETMELIAPHEPRPLRQEFRQQYGDSFDWEIVENKAARCRVQITKHEQTGSELEGPASDAETEQSGTQDTETLTISRELDVRDLPPAQRHEQIFEAYSSLDRGDAFVLVNDHDPKPLYHQFDAETGPEFHWEYRQREAGEFRVVIGKTETSEEEVLEETEPPF